MDPVRSRDHNLNKNVNMKQNYVKIINLTSQIRELIAIYF